MPNQLLGAPLGTDVQLECYVEAFPNTINYWLKNNGEMLLHGYVNMYVIYLLSHCKTIRLTFIYDSFYWLFVQIDEMLFVFDEFLIEKLKW